MVSKLPLAFKRDDLVQIIWYAAFIFLLASGLISRFEYNNLPATSILEIVFILTAAFTLSTQIEKKNFIMAFLSGLYVLVSFFYAVVFNHVHVLDFLQAYKAFIYISLLSVFLGRLYFELNDFLRFFRWMLVFFVVKYIYSRLLGFDERLSERPGILDENNFELMFLVLPLFALAKFKVTHYSKYFFAVFIIVLLSGSRSALLAVMICFVFTFFRKVDAKFFICLSLLPVLSYLSYQVFESRMVAGGGVENIDRIKLFYFFLEETHGWSMLDYVFGSERITRLSDATCLALPFYDTLYSFSGDSSCYSVILHSYIMRVIFDHGLIGLLFILHFYYRNLKQSGYVNLLAVGFILSIMASALSVSSFNSIYVAMSLALAVSVYDGSASEKDV